MTTDEKYEYWLDIAEYDLESANAMFTTGRWLYVVFMCQQAIEKLVKGLYIMYIDDNVPHIHDIGKIFSHFENKLQVTVPKEKYDFFNVLSGYYLNNRYPEYTRKLSLQLNEAKAKEVLSQAKEEFKWLLTLHP
jgi:HEPN domain-containing protein